MVVICKCPDPQNAKMAALFTVFTIKGWGPAVTHRWHFLWEKGKKKKKAEPVTRNNALAWRQPFCTTSGGTDRHREALASSWHRPDPRLRGVTDSQAGACQAWCLSVLTSVHTVARPPVCSRPQNPDLGISLLPRWPERHPPPVLCSYLAQFSCALFWGIIYPFRPCFVVRHDLQAELAAPHPHYLICITASVQFLITNISVEREKRQAHL